MKSLLFLLDVQTTIMQRLIQSICKETKYLKLLAVLFHDVQSEQIFVGHGLEVGMDYLISFYKRLFFCENVLLYSSFHHTIPIY